MRSSAFMSAALAAVLLATAPSARTPALQQQPAAAQQQPPAPAAPPEGPRLVVSYVEVTPGAVNQATALLRTYRDASRRDAGNTRLDIFQRTERPSHFVVVEDWQDEGARKAHRGQAHVTQFHDKLTPLRVSPYDERSHGALAVAPGAASSGALLVVTHVDVVPAGVPKAREMLSAQAQTSRKQNGNVRFDVLQGVRQNHFTVLEVWRDERAYQDNVAAVHTKTMRDFLQHTSPDAGLYDERLFRPVAP